MEIIIINIRYDKVRRIPALIYIKYIRLVIILMSITSLLLLHLLLC
jgi:hypothetical protein